MELPKLPTVSLPYPTALPGEINLPSTAIEYPTVTYPVLPSAKQMREENQRNVEAAAEEIQDEARSITARPQSSRTPPSIKLNAGEPQFKEVTEITLPGTDIQIPVPRGEILSTAVVTAGASSVAAVAGTLVASTLVKQLQPLLKPVMKTALKRLAATRGRPAPETFGRQRLRRRRSRRQS